MTSRAQSAERRTQSAECRIMSIHTRVGGKCFAPTIALNAAKWPHGKGEHCVGLGVQTSQRDSQGLAGEAERSARIHTAKETE